MSTIRVAQYFELLAFTGSANNARALANYNSIDTITIGSEIDGTVYHRYQNYFVNQTVKWPSSASPQYAFAPFRMEGSVSNLGGDNGMLQILFPNIEVAVRLVQQGNGNRLSRLTLTTVWLNENEQQTGRIYQERYIGIGAAFSETTIELRFRSAMDSVGAQFPARKLTRNLAGILPMSADISLR